jgi:hypothetical protein
MRIEGKSAAPSGDAITASAIEAKGAATAKSLLSIAISTRARRIALIAGSIAIVVVTGAGALGTSGLPGLPAFPELPGLSGLLQPATETAEAAPMPTTVDETRQLQGEITRLRADLAAFKTSVEAGTKSTNAQVAKITERLDRIDRTQTASRETTGSVPSPQPAVANASAPRQPVLAGWTVRDVQGGTAYIESRRVGTIEVEAGDTIQGLGRIETIRKQQDGRWVVVTSRGLITSPR